MEQQGKDNFILLAKNEGKTFYICSLCEKHLSSKRNAQYHLYSAHNKSKYSSIASVI